MSGNQLEPVRNSKKDAKTIERVDPEILPDPTLVQTVEQQLLRGGIRPDQAGAVARVVLTSVQTFHSGPLPSVETFSGYEHVCPGAARDILEMAKSSQKHNQNVDMVQVIGGIALNALGIISAVLVIGSMIYAALQAAVAGHDSLAIALASGTGLSLVAGVFVRNYVANKNGPDSNPASSSRNTQKKPAKKRN